MNNNKNGRDNQHSLVNLRVSEIKKPKEGNLLLETENVFFVGFFSL